MRKPLLDRLADKFTVGDGCWEWIGPRDRGGYGEMTKPGDRNGKAIAHRVVYEVFVGPISDGLHLDHLCRNRACVRPDHLEPVTQAENNRRSVRSRTHCPNGHPYEGSNLRWREGRFRCRACQTAEGRRQTIERLRSRP